MTATTPTIAPCERCRLTRPVWPYIPRHQGHGGDEPALRGHGGGGVISGVPVVRLLDAAGDAAWECRGKTAAVRAAHHAIRSGSGEESAAAFAVWRRAVVYDGPDLGVFLTDHYRDRGGIAISLKRAAFMAEQAAAGTSQ